MGSMGISYNPIREHRAPHHARALDHCYRRAVRNRSGVSLMAARQSYDGCPLAALTYSCAGCALGTSLCRCDIDRSSCIVQLLLSSACWDIHDSGHAELGCALCLPGNIDYRQPAFQPNPGRSGAGQSGKREVEILFQLSRELLQTENIAELLNAIPRCVEIATGASAVALYLDQGEKLYFSKGAARRIWKEWIWEQRCICPGWQPHKARDGT